MLLQVWLLRHGACDHLFHGRSASVRSEQDERGIKVKATGSHIPAGVLMVVLPGTCNCPFVAHHGACAMYARCAPRSRPRAAGSMPTARTSTTSQGNYSHISCRSIWTASESHTKINKCDWSDKGRGMQRSPCPRSSIPVACTAPPVFYTVVLVLKNIDMLRCINAV